ncbi:DUF3054 domain-containing protein [Paenibacillus ginsengarvi]|uniref:DUF3054 domain-containing protein n=1 Tax=Paenibacillus ginsengarvi TaxID=400777 RepID=A0A3B0CJ52_9BACL|nr:DUF3054 domain-containing protein [Paenibacillus ginsengarvi]RKN85413.1 DUF3054 domain-containing protein [Paenibacillus ginsengarvi]
MFVLLIAGGDLLVLFLFVLAGREDHDMAFSLTDSLQTALPFAIGWIVALLAFRTYRERTVSTFGKAAGYALLTCLIAVPLGLLIRSLLLGRPPAGTFAYVAFPLIASFMIVWRLLCAVLYRWAGRHGK